MKRILLGLLLAIAAATTAPASTLIHDFSFDTGFDDQAGRAEAFGTGGISNGAYQASDTTPLNLVDFDGLTQYTLVMDATVHSFANGVTYTEVLGTENRGGAEGIYFTDGRLATFRTAGRSGATDPLMVGDTQISVNEAFQMAITVDQSSDLLTGYINGVAQWQTRVMGTLQWLDDLQLFDNDLYPRTAAAGSAGINRVRMFDGALSGMQVADLVAPVPVPASILLLLAGLGGFAGLRRYG